MEGPGHQFLAGAGFTLDDDAEVRLGHPVHFPDNAGDGIAGAHHHPEKIVRRNFFGLGPAPALPFGQGGPHHPDDLRVVKGFGEIIEGPGPHGRHRGGNLGIRGNEDYRQVRVGFLDPL